MSAPTASPPEAHASRRAAAGLARASVVAGAALVAAGIGLQLARGASKAALVVPVGGIVALALVALAVTRFEAFVLAVLAARASLDAVKLGGGAGGAVDITTLLGLLFVVLGVTWLVLLRPRPRPSLLGIASLALLGAGALSVLGASDRTAALIELARMSAGVVMVLVLEQIVHDDASRDKVLVAIFVSAVIPLMVAMAQLIGGGGRLIGDFSRVKGTFLHPNPFAMYLVLLLLMGLAIVGHLPDQWRYPLASILVVGALALFATYARGAWIAMFVGVLVVGVVARRRALVFVPIVAALCLVLLVPSTRARFSDLTEAQKPSGDASNSLTWRFDYWGEALDLATANPLTGIGLKGVSTQLDEGAQPHNDYVRVGVEMGVIGLLTFGGYLATLLVIARRALRRARTGLDRGIAAGFCGCVAALVTLSLTSNILSQVVVLWYFVAFAVLASSIATRREIPPQAEVSTLSWVPRGP